MPLLIALAAAAAAKIAPLTSPGTWVTDDDYPPAAGRAGLEGVTGFMLTVSKDGMVIDCTVTNPSGSALLDDRTCELLRERAKFKPGRDARGRAVGGEFRSRIVWRLPGSKLGSRFPTEPMNETLRLEVGIDGRVEGCQYTGSAPSEFALQLCDSYKAGPPIEPFARRDGKPVAKVIVIRRSVTIEDR